MASEGLRDDASSKSSSDASFIKQSDTVDGQLYNTHIVEQPVTEQRVPYIPHDGDLLVNAGTPRATIAPSKEMPNGSVEWANTHQHKTVGASFVETIHQVR